MQKSVTGYRQLVVLVRIKETKSDQEEPKTDALKHKTLAIGCVEVGEIY